MSEETYKGFVPVIDVTFEIDINGNKRGSTNYNLSDATLVFSHPRRSIMNPVCEKIQRKHIEGGEYVKYIDNIQTIRGATKLERKINKNTIYINFPTYTEDSGGYGYDLGFTEDTFTLSMASDRWEEYDKVCKLVKLNNGEASGYMHMGISRVWYTNDDTGEEYWQSVEIPEGSAYYPFSDTKLVHTSENYNIPWYKVIVRTSDIKMDVGKMVYTYDLTLTVVYNG